MTNMLCESAFFGVVISLLAYELGMLLKKKFGFPIFNPLLIPLQSSLYSLLFSISIIRIIMTVQNT